MGIGPLGRIRGRTRQELEKNARRFGNAADLQPEGIGGDALTYDEDGELNVVVDTSAGIEITGSGIAVDLAASTPLKFTGGDLDLAVDTDRGLNFDASGIYVQLVSGSAVVFSSGEITLDYDVLDDDFLPYTGAEADVDLGSHTLGTTGAITGGQVNADNLRMDGNSVSATSGDLTLSAAGDDIFVPDHLTVGGGTTARLAKQRILGDADEWQLFIKAASGQTANVLEIRDNTEGLVLFHVTAVGDVAATGDWTGSVDTSGTVSADDGVTAGGGTTGTTATLRVLADNAAETCLFIKTATSHSGNIIDIRDVTEGLIRFDMAADGSIRCQKLTAFNDMTIRDNVELFFGTGADASIQYVSASDTTQMDVKGTSLVVTNTSTAGSELMALDQNDTDQPFIDFQGSSGADTTSSISSHGTAGTIQGWLQIEVNGTKRWIPFYDDPSA